MLRYCEKWISVPTPGDWKPLKHPVSIDAGDLCSYKFKINGKIFTEDTEEMRTELIKANTWIILQRD